MGRKLKLTGKIQIIFFILLLAFETIIPTASFADTTRDNKISISAGTYHTLMLKNDGTVWAFGVHAALIWRI